MTIIKGAKNFIVIPDTKTPVGGTYIVSAKGDYCTCGKPKCEHLIAVKPFLKH